MDSQEYPGIEDIVYLGGWNVWQSWICVLGIQFYPCRIFRRGNVHEGWCENPCQTDEVILISERQKDARITVRPTVEQMRKHKILHFKGKQYR